MIELFSGIGAQKRGVDNTNLFDLEVIATSDIDKDAVVEYAAIHHGLTNELIMNYSDYPSKQDMISELTKKNIGFDYTKNKIFDWSKLSKRKNGMELEKYWLAMKLGNNLGDISKIESLPYADILTYSFPCTDISVAGKQKGFSKDSGTRSGLLWEVERLLDKAAESNTLPKYLYLENVKNLVGKSFKPEFDNWCNKLKQLGYSNYWTVINAKHCGVPQNRERYMMISIRNDIDKGTYTFPAPFDTGIRLKDILEKDVDEKYYINTDRANNLVRQLIEKGQLNGQRERADSTINNPNTKDVSNCITARYDASIQNKPAIGLVVCEPKLKRLGGLWDNETHHQAGEIWDKNGIAPTLNTCAGGGLQPHIIVDSYKPIYVGNTTPSGKSQCNAVYSTDGVAQTLCAGNHGYAIGNILENKKTICIKQATKKGYIECELPGVADFSFPNSKLRRGRVQDKGQICPTLTAAEGRIRYIEGLYRIRKLTPRETFVLMGFTFDDCDKCWNIGQSNSALYKACGNSIVTNCITLLFEHLYKAQYDENYVCTDEKFVN